MKIQIFVESIGANQRTAVAAAPLRMCFLLFGLIFSFSNLLGQTRQQFHTLSTAWARPMAMGGAFMAVEDNLPALLYNPANFVLFADPHANRFTVFLNPVGVGAALSKHEHLHGRKEWRVNEAATALELFVRALAFGGQAYEFAALFGEESPDPAIADRPQFLNAEHYASNQYSLVAGRVKFADRVAIGATAGLYYQARATGRQWGVGFSYGVTLLSSRDLRIGVSYWSFPKDMTEYRLQRERIVHEAVNFGIAYKAPFGLLAAMDIRNVGEEAPLPGREFHFGVEQQLFKWLVWRAGYFRDRTDGLSHLSTGIGLIDQNLWRPQRLRLQGPDWAVQYALQFEKQGMQKIYTHALTFLIRL